MLGLLLGISQVSDLCWLCCVLARNVLFNDYDLVGLATAGLAYSVSRGLYIRPERVHRETFYQVKNSLFLREAMGITVLSPMKAGIMRVRVIK